MHSVWLTPSLAAVLVWTLAAAPTKKKPDQTVQASPSAAVGQKAVLHFEPNMGQTDPQVRYLSRSHGAVVFITDEGAVLVSTRTPATQDLRSPLGSFDPAKFVFESEVIRMNLVGARRSSAMTPSHLQESFSSYYIGKDRSKWLNKVPQFDRVEAKSIYAGVDIVYYGSQGRLEYDFVAAPGADTNQIHLAFSGQQSMRIAANGDLLLATAHGDFVQRRPVVYQEIGGKRVAVACRYRIEDEKVGFELARYDATKPLVIDPTLETSSYFGGNGTDIITAGGASSRLGTWVTGYTSSTNFPVAGGSPAYKGGSDAFVSLLSIADGSPVQSIYFGGSGLDVSTSVSASDDGAYSAYVCMGGFTNSSDFPLTANPAVPTYDTGIVGFVTCFTSDFRYSLNGINSPPTASSYVGTRGTQVNSVSFASDDATTLLIAGQGIRGSIFASPQVGINGGTFCWSDFSCYNSNTDLDGFVGTFRLLYVGAGQLSQSETGGTGDDTINAVFGTTSAFLGVGTTQSTNIQLHGAIKGSKGGSNQNVLIFAIGSGVFLNTYYGGNDGGDTATTVKGSFSTSGVTFTFGGSTSASTWPVYRSAFGGSNNGADDAFITQMSTNTNSVTTTQYSFLFGGSGDDFINALDLGSDPVNGDAWIYAVGQTKSPDLLTLFGSSTALVGQTTLRGVSDGFVLVARPSDGAIKMLTYLGGSGTDTVAAVRAAGNTALVAGTTTSSDFPTLTTGLGGVTAPFQPALAAGNDGFFSAIWIPNSVPVSLAAWDNSTNNSLTAPIPFSVQLNGCSSNVASQTYWTGTCNTTGTLGSMTFTMPAQYSANGAKFALVKGPDGTSAAVSTVTVHNFQNQISYVAFYDATYQLSITTAGAGSGTVTPVSGSYYHITDLIPIVATPAPGSVFTGWTVTSAQFSAFFGNAALASTTVNVGSTGTGASIVANFALDSKTTPVITWANPASITFGSALSPTQLNATANTTGTFAYTPALGTVLTAGNNQTLSVNFTPTDSTTYSNASASVQINVLPSTGGGMAVTSSLARSGPNVVVTVHIANTGAAAATNVSITSATFGAATGTPLPVSIGTIPSGGVGIGTVTLPNVTPGTAGVLAIGGSSSAGSFRSSSRITLP